MDLLKIVNSEEGKYLLSRLGHKVEFPIVKVTKNSFIEYIGGNQIRSVFFSRNPIERIFQPILDKISIANEYQRIMNKREAFLHYSGLEEKKYKYPQIFLTTTTFNPASGANSPVDGYAARDSGGNDTFAQSRGGNGTGSSATGATAVIGYLDCSSVSNQFGTCQRGFLLFDTSTITSAATISSAVFSLYVTTVWDFNSQSITLANATIAANNAVANTDYEGTTSSNTKQATDLTNASITTSAFNDWTLNATGLAGINKTGISKYCLRNTAENDNSAPTWSNGAFAGILANMADNGTNIPKLVVTSSVPSTGGEIFMTTNSKFFGA